MTAATIAPIVARLLTPDEIAANDYNLNSPGCVEPRVEQDVLTVDEAMNQLRKSEWEGFASEADRTKSLRWEGIPR
jgi:hypothetical protein